MLGFHPLGVAPLGALSGPTVQEFFISGGVSIPKQTVASAFVYNPPVTMTGGVTIPKATLTSAWTYTPPVTLSGGVEIPKQTTAGTAVYTPPVTLTGGVEIPKQVIASTWENRPLFTITGGVEIPKQALAGTVLYVGPVILTGGVTIPKQTVAGQAGYTKILYFTGRPQGEFTPGITYATGIRQEYRPVDLGLNLLLGGAELGGARLPDEWYWQRGEVRSNSQFQVDAKVQQQGLNALFGLDLVGGPVPEELWTLHTPPGVAPTLEIYATDPNAAPKNDWSWGE